MVNDRFYLRVLIISVLVLGGCQWGSSSPQSQIEVEVTYRERMMLPPNAKIYVMLQDVSKMDVAAITLNEQQLKSDGKAPPYRLTLSYDPSRLDSRHRYAVRAEIRSGGSLMFTTTEHIDPFVEGSPRPLPILVRRVQ
ncbi:YbaY family lipoprotein [Aestuariirhabdus sp. Z084]|uniref:YbaY family lipoprotein n=1 Tax=Aestuariirhabdus haliotis TaxID=2918751 RepID=UPI00201B39C2|nr:YbaY family lipoprotein [Aestuariirhabdus haliotis]MCL6416484.1 YbaY family lipoprotein [Aestuariirhabdus haliotis]MCL6420474.1 YbaY family lipoprotein [Aestuariirhabdus haliotis]